MSDPQAGFAQWEGKDVKVSPGARDDFSDSGKLEEVTEWGLVLHLRRLISWGEGGGQALRMVSEFRPWNSIMTVRVLEPEEQEDSEAG